MRKTVVSGLLVGAGLAVLMVGWLFRESSKIVFETDEAKTLGLQFEALSKVALRPLTSVEIASRLGLADQTELTHLVEVFAQRINAGYLPQGWDQECMSKYHKHLCIALSDYFERVATVKIPQKGRGHKRISFDPRKIADLQKEDFNILVSRIPDWSLKQFARMAEPAFKSSTCPRNLSLALARKLEIHLPDPNAWSLMRKLEVQGLECLNASDSGAEFNFLRSGLYELAQDHKMEAIALLEKARAAQDKKEEYRTLYWLAKAYSSVGREKEAQGAKTDLFKKFPVSWHTIQLKVENQIDPLDYFLRYAAYPDKYESKDDLQNLRVLWFQALLESDISAVASKKYGEFVVKHLDPSIDPGLLQYLARCLDRSGLHRLQIVALSQLVVSRPNLLTRETLRLLYPKPFYEELDKNSPHLDTAILLGLARQESGFDPTAKSGANAHGLLQLLPSTAKSLKKKMRKADLYDYAQNIELGARYVMTLIQYFGGSVEKALAAYNAGQGSVRKWTTRYMIAQDPQLFLDLMPFRETRDYVPSILRNAYWYHRLFPEMTASLSEFVSTSAMLKKQLFPERPLTKVVQLGGAQENVSAPVSDESSQSLDGDAESGPELQ